MNTLTPEQFAYWINGFFEISGAKSLDERQTQIVKDHLQLLFKKVTPVYGSGIAHTVPNFPLSGQIFCTATDVNHPNNANTTNTVHWDSKNLAITPTSTICAATENTEAEKNLALSLANPPLTAEEFEKVTEKVYNEMKNVNNVGVDMRRAWR